MGQGQAPDRLNMHGLDLPFLTAGNQTITSEATPRYNCVSHAVHEDQISLWPDDDNSWPIDFPRVETVEVFVQLFAAIGFQDIPLSAQGVTPGYEKIAIFALGGTIPTHVARLSRTR